MAQQVNLFLPAFHKKRSPFSALVLLQAWLALFFLGVVLGVAWIWNLNRDSASVMATLASNARELEALRAALAKHQAGTTTEQSAIEKALLDKKAELERRRRVADVLQQGIFQPESGHAARLELIAKTIPSEAWVTQINTDEHTLEIAGLTTEPIVLTKWANSLADSHLLAGQTLRTVKVEQVKSVAPPAVAVEAEGTAGNTVDAAKRPATWSYSLFSSAAEAPVSKGANP